MNLALLSALTVFSVTITPMRDSYLISVPSLLAGEKYSEVLIYETGSVLDHTQIASNKYLVHWPSKSAKKGKFSAILCGKGYCRPVRYEFEVPGSGAASVLLAWAIGSAIGAILTVAFYSFTP